MRRQRQVSSLFSKTGPRGNGAFRSGRLAMTLSLAGQSLRLYRLLLRQFYLNQVVIFHFCRYSCLVVLRASGGRSTAASRGRAILRLLIRRLPGLIAKSLPAAPALLPFQFFLKKNDEEPFIPTPGTPVPEPTVRLLSPPQPLIPLSHRGVIELQEGVCKRELRRRLNISLPEEKSLPAGTSMPAAGGSSGSAACLGRAGGVDRIISSLLNAAGGKRALVSTEELKHRLEVVLPLFLRVLEMQGAMNSSFTGVTSAGEVPGNPVRRLFGFRKRRSLEVKKNEFLSFSQSLYPAALEAARGRIIRENRLRLWREKSHHLEVLRENHRFGLYLESLDLLNELYGLFPVEIDPMGKDRLIEAQERLGWNYDY